ISGRSAIVIRVGSDLKFAVGPHMGVREAGCPLVGVGILLRSQNHQGPLGGLVLDGQLSFDRIADFLRGTAGARTRASADRNSQRRSRGGGGAGGAGDQGGRGVSSRPAVKTWLRTGVGGTFKIPGLVFAQRPLRPLHQRFSEIGGAISPQTLLLILARSGG